MNGHLELVERWPSLHWPVLDKLELTEIDKLELTEKDILKLTQCGLLPLLNNTLFQFPQP